MVSDLPDRSPAMLELRQRLENNNNPTSFPQTSMFNHNWQDWR
jgi:hypothetical protein